MCSTDINYQWIRKELNFCSKTLLIQEALQKLFNKVKFKYAPSAVASFTGTLMHIKQAVTTLEYVESKELFSIIRRLAYSFTALT